MYAMRPNQFIFRASISHACWSGTGDTHSKTLWFRRVANRSIWRVNHFDRPAWTPEGAVTILLIGSDLIWTISRPSHLGTLECVWHIMIFCNDGTKSQVSAGGHTFPLSGFLPVYLQMLPLLKCPWKSRLSDFCHWILKCFRPKQTAFSSGTFMYSLFSSSILWPFTESWSKWAPQPMTLVRIWTLWYIEGILPPVQVSWYGLINGGGRATEEISSSPWGATKKVSCEGDPLGPLFSVNASNPISDIKDLQSKHTLTLVQDQILQFELSVLSGFYQGSTFFLFCYGGGVAGSGVKGLVPHFLMHRLPQPRLEIVHINLMKPVLPMK